MQRFKALYDAGRYWDAHEALEQLWRATTDVELAGLYRGMIQVAAAYVHLERGNLRGGERLLRKATTNLERCPPTRGGVAGDRLLEQIASCLRSGQAGTTPAPPSLTLTDTY